MCKSPSFDRKSCTTKYPYMADCSCHTWLNDQATPVSPFDLSVLQRISPQTLYHDYILGVSGDARFPHNPSIAPI